MRLEAEKLGHSFGDVVIFQDVSFAIDSGEMVALRGPSGSGKSTLLSILSGSVTPTRGRVIRAGDCRVGWVFQNPHGVSRRTVLDHVVLPLLARGARRAEAERTARGVLAEFRLGELTDSPFRSLSGGEAQRLMLARALTSSPDLLLVDEPTAQLDPVSAATVVQVLGSLRDRGVMVLVATHDDRVGEACTRSIHMGNR
ncbi:ATP-binding cassette domain-containing protein [Actinoplanes teichomyceticus]|uniref:Putative ABC transport system ATP-binding protein/lipoprotein-releasing system ATP-binding protein n=1 Tax=Actinoplanes teichomyceticus TaxID=1867 RepID=A0A561VSU6_ACTTI|nr:ATP-binding cassette domain-containing protein [Actinoplanes teichomyceticus]TWG14702.1 putative ABC transport system ATP-binding protein/lipoprotein-releasing system ATP-binding protein [Actinoplanes teichomyceticus]GIF10105.1 ABC transporter ATP-binding protein [Actinoplanes teichomyceticus]